MILSYDEIDALQHQEKWHEAMTALDQRLQVDRIDVEARIQMIFLMWYILLEFDHSKLGFDKELLEKKLQEHFSIAQNLLCEEPEYLFFIGYIVHLTDWYFKNAEFPDAIALAEKMLTKVRSLAPQELLFEWGYHMTVTRDIDKVRDLGKKLSDAINQGEFKKLFKRGLLGEYFREIIKHNG